MASELAPPGVMIGHAASGWIRWAKKCVSGRRLLVKLSSRGRFHNHEEKNWHLNSSCDYLDRVFFFFFHSQCSHVASQEEQ